MKQKVFTLTAVMLMVSAGAILMVCPAVSAIDVSPSGIPNNAVVGQLYSFDLVDYLPEADKWGVGNPPYHLVSYEPGYFPSWLTITNGGGKVMISGTPTAPGSNEVHALLIVGGSSVAYKVIWTINVVPEPYVITFDPAGGSSVPSREVSPGSPYGTLPTPTKAGYTFDGWYDGATKVTSSTVPTKDVTLKAKWSANNIQYAAPPAGNLAAGTYWSHQLSTTPGVSITVSGAGTSWIQVGEGTIYGVPPSEGEYEVTVLLTAPNHISQEQTFTLTVVPELVLTNSPAAGAIAYVVG